MNDADAVERAPKTVADDGYTSTGHLIAFEGNIGAGKTTLTRLLSAHLGARAVCESFEDNQFLEDYYCGRARWALPMQLTFLVARHHQLKLDGFCDDLVLADYSFEKDQTFAATLLSGRELNLYRRIAQTFATQTRRPDHVVMLDGTDDILLERIKRRGRRYERTIDRAYLAEIRLAYSHHYPRPKRLMRMDTSSFDVSSDNAVKQLANKIVERAKGPVDS